MSLEGRECSWPDDLNVRASLCEIGNLDDSGRHKAMRDVSIHLGAGNDGENVDTCLSFGAVTIHLVVDLRCLGRGWETSRHRDTRWLFQGWPNSGIFQRFPEDIITVFVSDLDVDMFLCDASESEFETPDQFLSIRRD